MQQSIKPDRLLDVRGWSCPWCILKAKSQLDLMEPGQVLEVRVTDPVVLVDLPNVLSRTGHYLIQVKEQPEFSRLYVRRGMKSVVSRRLSGRYPKKSVKKGGNHVRGGS